MASDSNVNITNSTDSRLESRSPGLFPFFVRRQPPVDKSPPISPLDLHGSSVDAMVGHFSKNNPGPLGELQQNLQEAAPRSPRKSRDERQIDKNETPKSPTKSAFGKLTFKSNAEKSPSKAAKSREASPQKPPKKSKSGTNLAGLLSRPKSLRSLYKASTELEQHTREKENRTPSEDKPSPPIYAQFASQGSPTELPVAQGEKQRPNSYQVPKTQHSPVLSSSPLKSQSGSARPTSSTADQTPRRKPFSGFGHGRSKSTATTPTQELREPHIDTKEIDQQLEALLDRRNIPEHQRYKMRNLTDTIKLEFIRQDYAEMLAVKQDQPDPKINGLYATPATSGDDSPVDADEELPKRSRGRSFTFSRGKKDSASPTKKSKGEGTLGRHFRSRSTDSIASERPTSSSSSVGTTFFSKIKAQQGPSDYVAYLRKVQKPELVEVGKLHKLRLLLRNETVAWIEDFIDQGGMEEIVGLLNRIMEVEWREEHEDALLHENLLCLKGLSTTAKAMQYLHSVQGELFPKLLHLLFDPEKKGPSEFTTRNIITSVLLTYIQSANPVERRSRAQSILRYLRDPDTTESERPLPFVLEMRQARPYRVWCKEAVSVTKEVFWIFLHNLNVITLPKEKDNVQVISVAADANGPLSYMTRNFPQERPPVPAAPYVGGVEWDATNYLASHLDLMNAILACTPSAEQRNKIRAELRISGWEGCLGGSLRLCKEKFYGSVHIALRTWVAAAAEDGWEVKDVRFGPARDARRSPKKACGGEPAKVDEPPKLDMPKLDFGFDKAQGAKDVWL